MNSKREIIENILSLRYNEDGMQDRKRRLVNLFFSNILTNQEYNDTINMINEVSDSMRKDLGFLQEAGNIGNFRNRKRMIEEADEEQLEAYVKFNTNIRKHFDFKVGPEESKLYFRMGPQSSYFYIKLDHRLINETSYSKRQITYNDNPNRGRKGQLYSRNVSTYKPQVYINPKKQLFRNILNFMKETGSLEDFQFQFEEKIMEVI
jgi:hypothetical protein